MQWICRGHKRGCQGTQECKAKDSVEDNKGVARGGAACCWGGGGAVGAVGVQCHYANVHGWRDWGFRGWYSSVVRKYRFVFWGHQNESYPTIDDTHLDNPCLIRFTTVDFARTGKVIISVGRALAPFPKTRGISRNTKHTEHSSSKNTAVCPRPIHLSNVKRFICQFHVEIVTFTLGPWEIYWIAE